MQKVEISRSLKCTVDLKLHSFSCGNMKAIPAILCLTLLGPFSIVAQNNTTYDSRIEPPPHVFTWESTYDHVGIWESAHAEINGGFLGSVNIRDTATATITAGQMSSLEAREDASVQVWGVNADRIATRDRAIMDLHGGNQSAWGQVLAGGGLIRIFGGDYGWVLSWPGLTGRLEVYGGDIDTLSSIAGGTVLMRGGAADRLDAGGVSVLDSGTVRNIMSADGDATLVIAGGFPASDIRLFDRSRLIVLHTSGAPTNHVVYRLADFVSPGASPSFAGKAVNLLLDEGYKGFLVSAWRDTNFLSDSIWRGQMELIRVGADIRAVRLGDGEMLMAFLAPNDKVVQMETSGDLLSWQPWKSQFTGDGNTHVEVVTIVPGTNSFFRLRMWPKSGG